jgi:hypothetical protein
LLLDRNRGDESFSFSGADPAREAAAAAAAAAAARRRVHRERARARRGPCLPLAAMIRIGP